VLLSLETLETIDALETALEMLETFCIESRLIHRTLLSNLPFLNSQGGVFDFAGLLSSCSGQTVGS